MDDNNILICKTNENEYHELNFEDYINVNSTLENVDFNFNNEKVDFSFKNKTFSNCNFYNYNNAPFYQRNQTEHYNNEDNEEDIIKVVNVNNTTFNNCKFDDVKFFKGIFDNNTFNNCEFDGMILKFSKFNNCDMTGTEFRGCYLLNEMQTEKIFNNINVTNCVFERCNMNLNLLSDSYILVTDNRRVELNDYFSNSQNKANTYLSMIRIGEIINNKIGEIINVTEQQLADPNIQSDISNAIMDYLFPRDNKYPPKKKQRLGGASRKKPITNRKKNKKTHKNKNGNRKKNTRKNQK